MYLKLHSALLIRFQHILDLHPTSVFPDEWSANNSFSERAGYISLEKSETYAATARGAFELAGVDKAVRVGRLVRLGQAMQLTTNSRSLLEARQVA